MSTIPTTKGVKERVSLTPCFDWLRGLDLNQRPLGYEGAGGVHSVRHPTERAGIYAPPFRLVWSAVGRSTRKMHGKFDRRKPISSQSGLLVCPQYPFNARCQNAFQSSGPICN